MQSVGQDGKQTIKESQITVNGVDQNDDGRYRCITVNYGGENINFTVGCGVYTIYHEAFCQQNKT